MKNKEELKKVNEVRELTDEELAQVTGGASVSIPPSSAATAAVPMAISEATDIQAKATEAAKRN